MSDENLGSYDDMYVAWVTANEIVMSQRVEIEHLRTENAAMRTRLGTRVDYAYGIPTGPAEDEIDRLEAEVYRLRTALAEWKHRAVGGMCRVLSDTNCDCSLCKRDREIVRLEERCASAREVIKESLCYGDLYAKKQKWLDGKP